jgi:hypothetical protein
LPRLLGGVPSNAKLTAINYRQPGLSPHLKCGTVLTVRGGCENQVGFCRVSRWLLTYVGLRSPFLNVRCPLIQCSQSAALLSGKAASVLV